MGSPSSIIMGGLGNGTFNGSPSLIITGGYGIGDEVVVVLTGQRACGIAVISKTTEGNAVITKTIQGHAVNARC